MGYVSIVLIETRTFAVLHRAERRLRRSDERVPEGKTSTVLITGREPQGTQGAHPGRGLERYIASRVPAIS
jgi:hypothetical protein